MPTPTVRSSPPRRRRPSGRRRAVARRTLSGGLAVTLVASLLVLGTAGVAAAAGPPPYPASCPRSETYPTSSANYGLPIHTQILNGELTQGASKITSVYASVCGLIQFPSLSAAIPADDIAFSPATASVAGLADVGTVDITATGTATAVAAPVAAPGGGLVFSLKATTYNVINILGVSCSATLKASFTTAPGAIGKPLTGPLATGATGVAYAPPGSAVISGLTPVSGAGDTVVCPLIATGLGVPETTTATFSAPLTLVTTLTSF